MLVKDRVIKERIMKSTERVFKFKVFAVVASVSLIIGTGVTAYSSALF